MAFLFSFNCNELTVFCWFSRSHYFCKFSLFWSCHSDLSFPFYSIFWYFSLCDQLFLFLLTTLWRMGCLHISYVALESDLSLDRKVVGSWLVSYGCVKSITLVLPQPGYYYQELLSLELRPCPLGQLDPTILVAFPLQKNNLWTELTYLKSG